MFTPLLSMVITAAGFAFSTMVIIDHLSPNAFSKRERVFFCCLVILLFSLALIIGSYGVIVTFACLSTYYFLRKKNILTNISATFFTYFLWVFSDTLLSSIFYLLKQGPLMDSQDPWAAVLLSCLLTITSVTLSLVIGNLLHRSLSELFHDKDLIKVTAINFSVCLAIVLFNILIADRIGHSSQTTFFNGTLFFLYFLVTSFSLSMLFRSYKTKNELLTRQRFHEDLQEYTTQLETAYAKLRTFKHDHANIMLSLQAFIDNSDLAGLEHYLNHEITPQTQQILNSRFDATKLTNISCPEIKSFLYNKLCYASEIGIPITLEILDPITISNISKLDLIRILGVFLDNAIEASQEADSPELIFALIADQETLVILVANTFSGETLAPHELNKFSISTKGADRGIGLYNVADILSDYENIYWETEIKAPYFFQHLEISPDTHSKLLNEEL